jgi:hypothetical protein
MPPHPPRPEAVVSGGFARDFATADGETVMVAALTRQQFADLARTARLAWTFAFLERVLCADFSAADDLYAYRDTIAALLACRSASLGSSRTAASYRRVVIPGCGCSLTGRTTPCRSARR